MPTHDPRLDSLRKFALRNLKRRDKRTWVECLQDCWHNHSYSRYGAGPDEYGHLQSLRNDPAYGPGSGFIEGFKPDATQGG